MYHYYAFHLLLLETYFQLSGYSDKDSNRSLLTCTVYADAEVPSVMAQLLLGVFIKLYMTQNHPYLQTGKNTKRDHLQNVMNTM